MGGTSSRAARELPRRTQTPSWAGARTRPRADPLPEGPLTSENSKKRFEKDSGDPQLLSNLSRLNPVRVDHHMQAVRSEAEGTDRMFKSRAQSEFEAALPHPTRNRLHAPTLSRVLDERKSATSRNDLKRLASKYDIDATKLESLSRFVTSPSVNSDTVVRTVGDNGEEGVSVKAIWIEPHVGDKSSA